MSRTSARRHSPVEGESIPTISPRRGRTHLVRLDAHRSPWLRRRLHGRLLILQAQSLVLDREEEFVEAISVVPQLSQLASHLAPQFAGLRAARRGKLGVQRPSSGSIQAPFDPAAGVAEARR